MAEWLCSGLQIRVRRFDSGLRLQIHAGLFAAGRGFAVFPQKPKIALFLRAFFRPAPQTASRPVNVRPPVLISDPQIRIFFSNGWARRSPWRPRIRVHPLRDWDGAKGGDKCVAVITRQHTPQRRRERPYPAQAAASLWPSRKTSRSVPAADHGRPASIDPLPAL